MSIRSNKTRTRRSLLTAAVRKREEDLSFWKLLVIVPTVLLMLTVIWLLMAGQSLSMGGIVRVVLMLASFTVPITLLAQYSARLIHRHARESSKTVRRLLLAAGWLISGALGSLIALGIAALPGLRSIEPFVGLVWNTPGSVVAPLIITNGILASVVGISVQFFETAGERLKRRSILLNQEDLLTAEFQAARSVQQSLLPEQDAHIFGFDISGTTAPAVEIGGDYYDYLSFADGTKGIIVADAAGKGIPAALVMAKFQGMAQALSIHVADASEFFVGLNDTLRVRLDRRNFITVAMLAIDFDDCCTYYRAGHNSLFVYRAATGAIDELRPSGIALGLTHGATLKSALESASFTMETGDVALIFSDGLTEAVNVEGEAFDEPRVASSLRAAAGRDLPATAIRTAILSELSVFVGDAEPHDDVTIVVVKKV
jgi:serine phosphatase RsbU (regulator of sigma subunit)